MSRNITAHLEMVKNAATIHTAQPSTTNDKARHQPDSPAKDMPSREREGEERERQGEKKNSLHVIMPPGFIRSTKKKGGGAPTTTVGGGGGGGDTAAAAAAAATNRHGDVPPMTPPPHTRRCPKGRWGRCLHPRRGTGACQPHRPHAGSSLSRLLPPPRRLRQRQQQR
jgi:hypothetical protein